MDILKGIRRLIEGADLPPVEAAPPMRQDVATDVPRLDDLLSDPGLPARCRESARSLVRELDLLSGRAAARGDAGEAGIEIESLLGRHLPDLLRRYLDVPTEHRAEIFRRTGRSASFHLAAAIDVMADRARRISLELASGPLDDFATGTRFVETRYGREFDPFA